MLPSRLALVALVALATSTAVAGCGGGETHLYRDRGIEFRYPVRWSVSRVTTISPVRAVVTSYEPGRNEIKNVCHALATVPPRGAGLLILDYGNGFRNGDFPPRASDLEIEDFARGNYECFGDSYMLRFRVDGHSLQAHLRFGDAARASTRQDALRVLESIDSDQRS